MKTISAIFFRVVLFAILLAYQNQALLAMDQVDANQVVPQAIRQTSFVNQGMNLVKDHPIIATAGAVAVGAVIYVYVAPSSVENIVEVARHCITVPKEHLFAVAENVTTSADGYASKIVGWISECHNFNLYDKTGYWSTEPIYTTFKACNDSCWLDFELTGSTAKACYNLVTCWAKNASDVLTCDRPWTSWYVTTKDVFENFWSSAKIGFPSWYNVSNVYLGDKAHFPHLQFHYDATKFCSMCRYAWDCIDKFIPG